MDHPTSSEGGRARSKHSEDYNDALVLATAMASGVASEEQARSPSGGAHYQQLKQGDGDEDEEVNDRDDSSSTDHHPYLDQPQFPPSPMVTPPTRSYNAAEEVARRGSASSSSKKHSQQMVAGVPHVYHDYSQVPEDSSYIRKKTGGVTQPFPEKLHEMLRSVDGTDATEIVSWLPHGRAFLVRKPKEFTDTIMPK
jgi:HSF-type DNA-binding